MRLKAFFRTVSNLSAAAAALAMLLLLLATIYFTWFDLHWTAFFAGLLAAAVLSMVSRVSRSEWRLARRTAQDVRVVKARGQKREGQVEGDGEQQGGGSQQGALHVVLGVGVCHCMVTIVYHQSVTYAMELPADARNE